jgi:hypothetical protein
MKFKSFNVEDPYHDKWEVLIDTKGDVYFPCYQSVASVVEIGLPYVTPVSEIRRLVEALTPSVLVNTEGLPRGIQTPKLIHYTLILPAIECHNPKLYKKMVDTGVLTYLHKLVGFSILDHVDELDVGALHHILTALDIKFNILEGYKMDIEETLPSIIKVLESGCDAFTGMKMLNYLDRLNSTKTIPAVSIGLTSNDPFMQMAAARILGNLGSEEAIPALLLQLSNPNYKVRDYVVEAILNIDITSNNYYHRLIHNLFDSDDVVRLRAASELKNLSSVEEIPYLIVALEHHDKKVRHEAAQALGKLIFLSSIPHILNILKEDHAGMPMKEVLGNIRTTLESTATTLNQISKMLNVNTR